MPNIYVGQMRDIVKNFGKKTEDIKAKMAENTERFSAQIASEENQKLKDRHKEAYETAKNGVNKVFLQCRKYLAIANFPYVEDLTADRLIFENDLFILTDEDVKGYIERYENNYTMLRLIQDWLQKKNVATSEKPMGLYADIRIIMPIDVLRAYKQFADSALSLIDKVYESELAPQELEVFADERFAHALYDIVGTGNHLVEYGTKRVPETAKHQFDNITLQNVNREEMIFKQFIL